MAGVCALIMRMANADWPRQVLGMGVERNNFTAAGAGTAGTTTAAANLGTPISSLRVEKPGKARFEPILGGERRRPLTREQFYPPQPQSQSQTQQQQRHPARVIQDELDESSPFPMAPEVRASEMVTPVPATKLIEGVATRRERRRSATVAAGMTIESEKVSLLETGRSAASLVNITPSTTGRVTMAHFLRDMGTGVPMSSGTKGADDSLATVGATATTTTRTVNRPSSTTMTVIPQVRVVDGELVVEERLLEEEPASALQTTTLEVVNETGKHLTSHAFVKTIGPNRWSREETDRFYEALSMCGTDFALISLLFARRTREQVKGKYKVEERLHPGRVALALKRRRPLDVGWLEAAQQERHALTGASITAPSTAGALVTEERKPGRPKRENLDGLLVASSPARSMGTGAGKSPLPSPVRGAGGSLKTSPIKTSPVGREMESWSVATPRSSSPSSHMVASPVRRSSRVRK